MNSGGADTHKLAEAAKKQAENLERHIPELQKSADAAKRQADKTETISASSYLIANALRTSVSQNKAALEQAAKQSREALDLSMKMAALGERPWLVIGSFNLQQEPEANKKVKARIGLINTGKSPALDANTMSDMALWESENT